MKYFSIIPLALILALAGCQVKNEIPEYKDIVLKKECSTYIEKARERYFTNMEIPYMGTYYSRTKNTCVSLALVWDPILTDKPYMNFYDELTGMVLYPEEMDLSREEFEEYLDLLK